MEEILCRAKRKDDGSWVEGAYYKHKATGRAFIIQVGIDEKGAIAYLQEVDDKTVGRYMGREDKYGRKLFEGDILLSRIAEYPYVVYYESCSFSIEDRYGNMVSTEQKFISYMELEVVGNVHDTPELLEV